MKAARLQLGPVVAAILRTLGGERPDWRWVAPPRVRALPGETATVRRRRHRSKTPRRGLYVDGLLSPRDVALRLGLISAEVRALDRELQPERIGPLGWRAYREEVVEAYARRHPPLPPPSLLPEWSCATTAARFLRISYTRLYQLDERLAPDISDGGRRRYHVEALRSEARRRGMIL